MEQWLLLLGTADAGNFVMLTVLLVGSLLAVAYLMPIPVRAFLRPPAQQPLHGEASVALAGPLTLTAFACLALFVGAGAVLAPLSRSLGLP